MEKIIRAEPGVDAAITLTGVSVTGGFGIASNSGVVFATLDPQSRRKGAAMSATSIAQRLQGKVFGIEDAFIGVVQPPPVSGMGTLGGFKLQL